MEVNTKHQSMAKKVGRPTDEPQTHQMQTRVTADFLRKLDEWRRQQPDLPSRTEALRRIVETHPDIAKSSLPAKGGAKK
jgi:hypothetical protein